MSNIRIGHGCDVHQLVAGRKLVIGGVTIEWHLGLHGHSDADVLLHAVCDACLGAAGLGDLGRHFPSSDPAYRGADSRTLVRQLRRMLDARGWRVANLDCTVIAERPPLSPHTARMEANIAADLGIAAAQVNVKATTTDGLGLCGRGEGIAALAVALLERPDSNQLQD